MSHVDSSLRNDDAADAAERADERGAADAIPLAPRLSRLVRRAEHWLSRGELDAAAQSLDEARRLAPAHAEISRRLALVRHAQKRYREAIALLEAAAALRPDDPEIQNNLGSAYGEAGDLEAAARAFARATELAPTLAIAWLNLGGALDRALQQRDAERAYARALEIEPGNVPARTFRAATLTVLGRLEEAAAEYREALRRQPDSATAWWGLAGLKSTRLDDAEIARLADAYARESIAPDAKIVLGFAYGQALQAAGDYERAFAVFVDANAARSAQLPWSIGALSGVVDDISAVFAQPVRRAGDGALGREAIFLIGMPRSGSTLTEQILCAHGDVEGIGESGDLPRIIHEESRRRGIDFPHWAGDATEEDWQRLGEDYLARARTRTGAARFTDKTLANWQLVGALRAMLPGARVVDCRRAALDTSWSCFTHLFASGQPFTYAFDRLAGYWHDYDRLMRTWDARYPGLVHIHEHAALVDDAEAAIRRLLDACGLAFDPACLAFDRTEREVRTMSASQVRSPIRRSASYSDRYGALLDPLRAELERFPAATTR